MLVCELAASLKMRGLTILDALKDIYDNYGIYLANVQSLELTGADAMEKAANLMAGLRSNIPSAIGGAKVTCVKDYLSREQKNLCTGEIMPIHLPKSNVLEFILGDHGTVIARPSGTEPKVKFYYTAVASTLTEAETLLNEMKKQMAQ